MLKKIIILFVALAVIAAYFIFDLGQYLSLDALKESKDAIQDYYKANKALTIGIFFGVYVVSTALNLPGALILTLAGGAIFGLVTGLIIVSFASTIGATCAFLISRTLLRDSINNKFGQQLKTINEGIEKEGAFYLFTLRLIPIIPFFVINLVFGLTKLKTFTFYWVSQIGMLAGTAVYVNAGTQLAQIDSLAGIVSPQVLGSFILLGLFPLLAKKLIDVIKANRVYKSFKKPKKFDYNLVAIGAGSAGLVTSYIGAAVKAKVALIEKHKMGGDCLNTGCVPSKALIRSAKFKHILSEAEHYGFANASAEFEFKNVMNRVHNVIKKIEPHDSIERYSKLGVECITGEAKIISPWEIEVNGKTITTKNIVIATGARPFVPPIPGLDKIEYLTSDNVWSLTELPKKLLVLGGGPIGSELSQSFNRLGSEVTQVEMNNTIMGREDPEISAMVMEKFIQEGVNVKVNHKAIEFISKDGKDILVCETTDTNEKVEFEFDKVLVAIGRKPNTQGFGLESLDMSLRPNGTIETNEYLQTKYPNIYACGDVAGPYQFTHTAAHQAWYCAVNSLFGKFKKFKADYRVIPWATFTEPEVARVGLNEQDAKAQNIPYEVTTFGIDDLDRAIAEGSDYGVVKVLTEPGKDKILGVTLAGEHAGDLIAEFVLAMKYNLGLNKILGTIHSYPTMAEANKYVAGEWKRANAPEKVLHWIEKYHRWVRG